MAILANQANPASGNAAAFRPQQRQQQQGGDQQEQAGYRGNKSQGQNPTIQTILAHDGTTLATGNSASSAKSGATLSKSTGNGSKKTSPALK
jgi:hypothetical protein